jgi:hypothetical protein
MAKNAPINEVLIKFQNYLQNKEKKEIYRLLVVEFKYFG